MKLSRERTDTLFRVHVAEGGLADITDLVKLDKFTYQLVRAGVTHRALVLARSWDYWEYRLSRSAPAVSMVICSTHDSCLSVPVLEVGSSGRTYGPRERPLDYVQGARHTRKTALVFIGALLCGEQAAFNALSQMHPSAQRRYRDRLNGLLTPRREGHQLAISKELKSVAAEKEEQAVS
jgi:hypothetical protein